ncbi:MAG TPA: hypothetical protein VII82_13520 [Polyangiaceae bacterium]
MALQMTPGAGKQVPVAEHPAVSGKPQRSPVPQSASVVHVPPSPPAPEPLLDPELPLDDPDAPLDPELPLDAPDLPLDPELPLDPPELFSAAASLELSEPAVPEQPMA